MPRNSSGTYALPIAAFSPGGVIKSGDHNSNYSDIATALTQSLATTGVSTMTGPILAAAGGSATPSVTFSGSPTTGFYLAGVNQIGWAAAGSPAGTFNANGSVSFGGAASVAGVLTSGSLVVTGSATIGGASVAFFPTGTRILFSQAAAPSGWTQIVAYNDYALRLVSGAGGGTAGTRGFSTIFNASITNLAAHVHPTTEVAHTHSYNLPNSQNYNTAAGATTMIANPILANAQTTGGATTGLTVNNAGGGSWITLEVLYLDVILCQRN